MGARRGRSRYSGPGSGPRCPAAGRRRVGQRLGAPGGCRGAAERRRCWRCLCCSWQPRGSPNRRGRPPAARSEPLFRCCNPEPNGCPRTPCQVRPPGVFATAARWAGGRPGNAVGFRLPRCAMAPHSWFGRSAARSSGAAVGALRSRRRERLCSCIKASEGERTSLPSTGFSQLFGDWEVPLPQVCGDGRTGGAPRAAVRCRGVAVLPCPAWSETKVGGEESRGRQTGAELREGAAPRAPRDAP